MHFPVSPQAGQRISQLERKLSEALAAQSSGAIATITALEAQLAAAGAALRAAEGRAVELEAAAAQQEMELRRQRADAEAQVGGTAYLPAGWQQQQRCL